jgi:hypothetical protein
MNKNSDGVVAEVANEEETDMLFPEIMSTYCINGISPSKTTPLNEAISGLAGVSLEKANELIQIGAVWARIDTLTEEDLLAQYENDAEDELYGDLPKGWGVGKMQDYSDLDLEEYVEKMQSQRFKRILSPVLVAPGTDLRLYVSGVSVG